MVIDNFHIKCVIIFKMETNSEFIVDSYAVLALSVPFQGFQPIARRNSEVIDVRGAVNEDQLP
jgi:hypothetical protein